MKQKLAGVVGSVLAVLRPLFGRKNQFLIIAPADSGSCGDQAMIESIRSVVGDKLGYDVALMHPDPIKAPVELRGPVTLFNRLEADYASNRLVKLWRRGSFRMFAPNRFGFIGADMLDGSYREQKALLILGVLRLLTTSGAKGQIFGSSISETRSASVMRRLNDMPDVLLHTRDPLSQARFEKDFGRQPVLAADVAFLLKPAITSKSGAEAERWLAERKSAGHLVLGVNINGRTLASVPGDGQRAFADLLTAWMEADKNRSILMLPHDIRPAPVGDVEVAQACLDTLSARFPGRVEMLRPPLNAWELKHLAGMVDFVLTGRMHLTIAALGMGTPSLSIAYLNKFEGLLQLFGIDGLVVEPDLIANTTEGAAKLEEISASVDTLSKAIKAKLPEVLALSAKNFEPLDRKA